MSCLNPTLHVDDFTAEETLWFKPFTKAQTLVYVSEKGEKDTLLFSAIKKESDATRSLEQGFSNTNYQTVNYQFSKGSYHQAALMSDGKTRYEHWFVNCYKSSAGYGSLEITFIGTFFSENIQHIQKLNDSTYFFDSKKADYAGMNVNRGILSFTFNTHLGVTQFVDDRNIQWHRMP